jgi:hypothetical protein
MHIESTTTFHEGLHDASLAEAIAAPQVCSSHCYASFPFFRVRQNVIPLPARVSLSRGICVVTVYPDLQAIAVQRY